MLLDAQQMAAVTAMYPMLQDAMARRMMKKNKGEADASAGARATVMTMQHEVLTVTPSVTEADVAIPAGFTQR